MLSKLMSNADKILIGIMFAAGSYIVINVLRAGIHYAMN